MTKKRKRKKQDIHYMAHEFMFDYSCDCIFVWHKKCT